MEVQPITESEKEFVLSYTNKQTQLQNACALEEIVYSVISLQYAIINNLLSLNIVFHPSLIKRRKTYESSFCDIKTIKEAIENVIIYETTNHKIYLTAQELNILINHFRLMQMVC